MMTEFITSLATVSTALGGCELIKYLINGRSNSRIARAKASTDEFHALREYNEFLQQQLRAADERYSEQTANVRSLSTELIKQTRATAMIKSELDLKRCEVLQCPHRQPPLAGSDND